jgi:hypothetical protein
VVSLRCERPISYQRPKPGLKPQWVFGHGGWLRPLQGPHFGGPIATLNGPRWVGAGLLALPSIHSSKQHAADMIHAGCSGD